MAVTADYATATTYDEAVEAGYWGSVLVLSGAPDPPTLAAMESAPDITSDEYAEWRRAEAHPPEPEAPSGSHGASKSKSSSKSGSSSSSSSKGDDS